jgi:hypothetical protein
MIRKTAAIDHLQTARIDATPNAHQDIDDKYQSETIVEVDVHTGVPIDQASQSMRHFIDTYYRAVLLPRSS